uniref:Target of myb1 like 2 membrane trafficking protein n=1 Tax=Oryctolagus cuniculus TaxID=9986 RepID=A0A5F9DKI4_RABIT
MCPVVYQLCTPCTSRREAKLCVQHQSQGIRGVLQAQERPCGGLLLQLSWCQGSGEPHGLGGGCTLHAVTRKNQEGARVCQGSLSRCHQPAAGWPSCVGGRTGPRADPGVVPGPAAEAAPVDVVLYRCPRQSVPEVDPAAAMPRSQPQQRTSSSSYSAPPPAPYSAQQAPALSITGPITANSEQIARLRSELDVVRGNTKVMSEMLTEMVPGQEDSSDLELLQELNRTCRAMQQRVVELISRVSNEEVTEELLHVNDDLNNVFLRYERFERYRSGRSAQNASNGVLNEVTEDNLIDLGPGSPAVVSPMVGNTAPPASLSSQLAGLDLGTESVSGTLSSLQQCSPRDGFDMFAQTRGNSLAEQRKTVTYEDAQATSGLATALDHRKQTSEVIPVAQPSVMDDIEVWLRTDLVRRETFLFPVRAWQAEASLRTGLGRRVGNSAGEWERVKERDPRGQAGPRTGASSSLRMRVHLPPHPGLRGPEVL